MIGLNASIADLKATIEAADIKVQSANLRVYDYMPFPYVPPMVAILPDDPYVSKSESNSKSEMVVNLRLYIVLTPATVKSQTTVLNDLIEDLVPALGDWYLQGFTEPYISENNFLVCEAVVTNFFNLDI